MKTTYTILILLISMHVYAQDYLLGVDLSYANEMNDCGATYTENGISKEVFQLFADHGSQVVRIRLWHSPDSTNYSTYEDVKRSIERAKNAGMKVLLDFHYSDTWADPSKQTRPQAWSGISNLQILSDSVYNYTHMVLTGLADENLLPEYVQIGNETNGNIMVEQGDPLYPLDWPRNIQLFNAGIRAAKDVNNAIQTVIHIADPAQAVWWFQDAAANLFTGFDIIGLSYYPEWHPVNIQQVGEIISGMKSDYNKPVWIVETGYPWTLENNGDAGNILGEASLLPGYANPPTINSQKNFLINLTYEVISNGGFGVIYWEPAWVTTSCATLWGIGSHYENATFFNFENQLHEGIGFLAYDYAQPPSTTAQVSFYVDMTGIDHPDGVFVTGDFTGENWQFMPMSLVGNNIYRYTTAMQKGSEGAYIFTKKADWDMAQYHEQVPAECAPFWGTHRKYSVTDDQESYAYMWSSCHTLQLGLPENSQSTKMITAYPNPFKDSLSLLSGSTGKTRFRVLTTDGRIVGVSDETMTTLNTHTWKSGIYTVQLLNHHGAVLDNLLVIKID